jgi:hypothetical protein
MSYAIKISWFEPMIFCRIIQCAPGKIAVSASAAQWEKQL